METNKQGNLLNAISELNGNAESITINWEQTGLLEGLNEDEKSIVAWNLEQIAQYLLSENCPIKDNALDIVAFPAARRVLKKDVSYKLNIPDFLSELASDYATISEIHGSSEVDLEAEFLAKWCDKYAERNISRVKSLNEERNRWKLLAGIK